MGREVIEQGLTHEQMTLFAHAIDRMCVEDIHINTLPSILIHDKDGSKKYNKEITKRQTLLAEFLFRFGEKNG